MDKNLKQIFDQHKNKVYNLALNYVLNIEDAEEITQDVFLKIFKNIENFRNEAELSTWIYRITVNTCLDFIKSKNRKKRALRWVSLGLISFETNENSLKNFNHPGITLEQKEEVNSLLAKINELPEQQKTALILNKIEGLSVHEICEIMKLKNKAVESLIMRAKISLQKKIK